ncbi:hypothetical protein [Pseudomonas sp. CFBP 13727]|uniref:hypothetical protein n=1 Tax=Pseudomonas sp. CFBP 13727 TaxID=2775295 RepID=UPI0017811128|nr:hypothetical protein [Pseudomonas sp. CFBP 13727]MBD8625252.1 hypothetical protein [Pseudomonas sp. CFBP 13727]
MLGAAEQLKFNLASPSSIANALSRASANFPAESFLASSNGYQVGVGESVKKLIKTAIGPLRAPELVESIAVSSILHLFDGWSYLAQALRATFRNDDAIARHLAYYGELRASLSILASYGVGIFSTTHVVIDAAEDVHKFSKEGTHQVAWSALEAWGKTPYSGALIGAEIQAFGHSMADWIMVFQGTSTPSLIGADWVENWGIDLSAFSSDRATRNEVSYGVDFDHSKACHTPRTIEPWLRELWLTSEPGAASFELLDRYLVRSTLEGIYNTKFKDQLHTPEQSTADLREKMLDACIAIGQDSDDIVDFFIRDVCKEDLLVMNLARARSAVQDPLQYQEVMSRTYLLLRLATASVGSLLREASLSSNDLAFWWVKTSEASGLWDSGLGLTTAEEVKDLWADTLLSLDELSDCIAGNPTDADSWFFFNTNIPNDLEILSRMEKVALWGIS